MPFYAISSPPSSQREGISLNESSAESRVFETVQDALKALKTNKQSRLSRPFDCYTDALKFASESSNVTESGDDSRLIQNNATENTKPAVSEGCPYKSLTPQELKMLKQAIIDEDDVTFDKLVSENPRYLVTTCDTPSIIHSGTRANALHIAASVKQKGSPKMTQKVLDSISNPNLMERMYPEDSAETRAQR